MLVVSNASAEESVAPPAVRAFRDFARGLLVQIIDEQRAEFDRITDRYVKLIEFTKRLEARDEADFEEKAARYERLRAFTRELEAEQAEREARDFEARVDLVIRERAFTRELERRRAAEVDTSTGTGHPLLYRRE